mmetsp:Transcript_35152/g.69362  ORF Transcript_35152/g.69362 Transcript_35152/m.69362 type:complete len:81 (+) Transcript_35152:506-748(+)
MASHTPRHLSLTNRAMAREAANESKGKNTNARNRYAQTHTMAKTPFPSKRKEPATEKVARMLKIAIPPMEKQRPTAFQKV